MARERTFPPHRVTERQKARVRLPVLTLLAFGGPPLTGMRVVAVWSLYVGFVVLYSLWTLRLVGRRSPDRRLGYLFCLTDAAIVLPLLAWTSSALVRVVVVLLCICGAAITIWGDRASREDKSRPSFAGGTGGRHPQEGSLAGPGDGMALERAVSARLRIYATTGARFALVVLRVVRFEETASYYGAATSERILSALGRRSLRLLGPDAQRFALPGGRVALLFETEPENGAATEWRRGEATWNGWSAPHDVESLAMALGRRACEHLVDGHRIECVVGWASAPADGLTADDLMDIAESGAQSTAAFRRVAGSQPSASRRARAAAG